MLGKISRGYFVTYNAKGVNVKHMEIERGTCISSPPSHSVCISASTSDWLSLSL